MVDYLLLSLAPLGFILSIQGSSFLGVHHASAQKNKNLFFHHYSLNVSHYDGSVPYDAVPF